MKNTIAFMLNKRREDDVVLLFDGRSKKCRRVIELFEEELAANGAHVAEIWLLYLESDKKHDPRVPSQVKNFSFNNKEVVLVSRPGNKGKEKVQHREDFNTCGENSTTSTTYTAIPMRRFRQLPRMEEGTKMSILGGTATGVVHGKRLQRDIVENGHPYSWAETKPVSLLNILSKHLQLTHIVDFTPGSAALAVAVAGEMQYEGIASVEEHQQWLDNTMDRCFLYQVAKHPELATELGGDTDLQEKVARFFNAQTMREASRYIEPPAADETLDYSDSSDDNDEGALQ